jgi:hypothetical protein
MIDLEFRKQSTQLSRCPHPQPQIGDSVLYHSLSERPREGNKIIISAYEQRRVSWPSKFKAEIVSLVLGSENSFAGRDRDSQ